MWDKYDVVIQIRDRIVGGIPKDPAIIDVWLESRGLKDLAEKTKEEMAEQAEKGQWQGFKGDEGGLYIEARQIKSMLKEAANIVRRVIKFKGYMKARVAERVFIRPVRLHLGVAEPSGYLERTIHVPTARGPRAALKRCDYVKRPKLTFSLWVLDDGIIKEEHLRALLNYAGEAGLGADRSQGEGKFDLLSLEYQGKYDNIGDASPSSAN